MKFVEIKLFFIACIIIQGYQGTVCRQKDVTSTTENLPNATATATPSNTTPNTAVLVIGDPWTILNITDFSPASPNCTIPKYTDDSEEVHSRKKRWSYAPGSPYGQIINGVLYICTKNRCKTFKNQNKEWETIPEIKLDRSRSGSTVVHVTGAEPKWVVHGGDERHGVQKPTQLVFTPETKKWDVDPDYRSPLPVYGHCIVALNGKIMQVGGVNDGTRGYQDRVFLGKDEVASMKHKLVYHTCVLFQNRVWVAGGGSRSVPGSTEVYNPTTDTWTDGPTLPLAKQDYNSRLIEIKEELYYIGGSSAGKIFKLEENSWVEVATIPKSSKKSIVGIFEMDCEDL